MNIHIVGQSVAHAGDRDKPNEDAFWFHQAQGVVAVADGVSMLREQDGSYPVGGSREASLAVVQAFERAFQHRTTPAVPSDLHDCLQEANDDIRALNEKRYNSKNLYHPEAPAGERLSTTAVALLMHENKQGMRATFCSVGDPLVLRLRHGTIRVMNTDQLEGVHAYSYPLFQQLQKMHGWRDEVRERERRLWQWRHTRNKSYGLDKTGEVIGYGVLDGNPHAEAFFEQETFDVLSGDRLIVASDGLRIGLRKQLVHPLIDVLSKPDRFEALHRTIRLIREGEQVLRERSDDLTMVLVDVT